MTAFYDFFRKIRFLPNDVAIEADSVIDEAQFQAGVNIAFDVEDSTTGPGTTTDRVVFNGPKYDAYVANTGLLSGEGAVLRLERDPLGTTGVVQTDITIESDPTSPILVDRIDANTIRIGSSSPTLPFSQEQIEDFSAALLLNGTHTEITVNYDDLSIASGNLDLAVTSTLQQVTNRGATTTNAITITDATGSSNTSTGALRVTAGGLAVFENINAGGNISGNTLTSIVATGTAPLTVASTTEVANLRAATASKWHSAITLSLTGDVTGSANIDGSGNVSISTTVGTDTVALGTDTTGNYVAAGAVSGNGLSGSASSEGATFTVSSNATATNTAETIVFRDGSGNFSAGTITATLSGNASTATTLATSRNFSISGVVTATAVSFNGGADVSLTTAFNSTNVSQFTNDSAYITLTSLSGSGDITYNNTTGAISFNNATGYITRTGISATGNISYDNSTGIISFNNSSGYLTAESDTLASVTGRGATTATATTFSGGLTSTGVTTLQKTTETISTLTGATGTVNHDFNTGLVWWHTSLSANFTANFTNVPTTDNKSIVFTLFLVQGATARIPSAVQIGGVAQTINWVNNSVPAGTANRTDIVNFTLIRVGAAWNVFGSLTSS